MKQRKFVSLFLSAALALSMLAGCSGKTTAETQAPAATETATEMAVGTEVSESASAAESVTESAEDCQAAAEQLMKDLTGSYQELWPVILTDEYTPGWMTAQSWLAKTVHRPLLTNYHLW